MKNKLVQTLPDRSKLLQNKIKFNNKFFKVFNSGYFIFFYIIFNRRLFEVFQQTQNDFVLKDLTKTHPDFLTNIGTSFDLFREVSVFSYSKFSMRSLKHFFFLSRGLLAISANLQALFNFNTTFLTKGVILGYISFNNKIFNFKNFSTNIKSFDKNLKNFINLLKFLCYFRLVLLIHRVRN